jgi:hypothetical protein
MHEAEVILLERAALPLAPVSQRQAPEPFGFKDAIDSVPVEMRQIVRDDEGEVVERKAGRAAQGTDDRPLFLSGFLGQLVRPAAMTLAVLSSTVAPFTDGLGTHAKALGQHTGGLGRVGNLASDRRDGAGLGMDRQHHVLL